jgi:ring-1,2-phenylacetyl-CoA epoxidase subunit PaaC
MSDEHTHPTPTLATLAPAHGEADAHWAFGTGFEDPLHGVSTAVPAGVDAAHLAVVCIALGDDALVSAQRLAEWCTRAPELEEELALANIGLDLLGQARLLYSRAGQVDGTGRVEDDYAYRRDAPDFRNVRLAELPNGDFAFCIARLLVLSCWRLSRFEHLAGADDPVLSAIAEKGVKELTYHWQYAADWTVRLAGGTALSRERMAAALGQVLLHLEELFAADELHGVDPAAIRVVVTARLAQVSQSAGLPMPLPQTALPAGRGRNGEHTEHLAPLLAELQSVFRALPGAVW